MSSGQPTLRTLINIDVPELDAGVRFYTTALELRVGRRLGERVVELLGAEVPIYLIEKSAGSLPCAPESSTEAAAARTYARHWTAVHLDFAVPALAPALDRARASGARLEEVSEHSWGTLALLADPFGHGFCLIEFRNRGYDEIAIQ